VARQKIVFAWGTFDLLRAGHIEYLKKARALGDYLVVAVYSDAVVSRRYGKTRPIVPQKERMEVLSSFAIVDRVMLLQEWSPHNKIKKIAPDIIARCGVENDSDLEAAVSNMNLKFVRIKPRSPKSTTALIQKIRKLFSDKHK
jgi:D-beta-D-heptose 7-phosphate kinase/D-beta-D-heptose 1-phosphate adenosyltransferase